MAYLFDIANRDLKDTSDKILDYLCRTESIIANIIVPNIIDDAILNKNFKYRDISLLIINRLGPLVKDNELLEKLSKLVTDQTLNKKLLFAAIRSFGKEG